jgi:DNA-binding XRE family transcriptional regulator
MKEISSSLIIGQDNDIPPTFLQRGHGTKLPPEANGNLTLDQLEFILAVNDFKQKYRRNFPSLTELFNILISLGYEKIKQTKRREIKQTKEENKKLKEILERFGLTQVELANRLGVTQQYISGILVGKFAVSKKMEKKIDKESERRV